MTIEADKLLASITKNAREEIRIQLRTFKGNRSIDVRVFALTADGDWIATAKGVSIKPELLGTVLEGLAEARTQAKAEGLLP